MKYKYDRPAIKLEFFQSDFDEVQPFFKERYDQDTTINKQVAKMTKWRAKEKQAYKQKILEKALQKNINKRADKLEIPLEALKESKMIALWKIMEMLAMKPLSMKDIALWLEKIKTELGEPAHIGANYNLNANKVEWLSEEEIEALDILFSWKVKKQKKSNK